MKERAVALVEARGLGTFADSWDALVEGSRLPSPFLRSWWLEGTASAQRIFLLALDGDSLVGGLALQQDRYLGVPRLGFMGSGPLAPDHLDLVAARGWEQAVTEALGRWFRRSGSRIIELRGASECALVEAALPVPVLRRSMDVAPYEPLPADPANYFANRPSRLQNTLRRAGARLERAGVSHRIVEVTQASDALERLRSLHQGVWGPSGFIRGFSGFAAAARAGMERGELVIHELVCHEGVVASSVMLEVADRSSFYQSGRSLDHHWRGAGSVLMGRIVEDACRRGSIEFDLLRGDDAYKRDWATKQYEVVQLLAVKGMPARLALLAMVAGRRGRRLVTRLLEEAQATRDRVRRRTDTSEG